MGGGAAKGFVKMPIQRHCHADVEAPADERQAQRFTGSGGNLDAQAAIDALAGLENHVGMMGVLLEFPPLAFVSLGIGA